MSGNIDLTLLPGSLQVIFVLFFGLCIGSFLNVVIFRVPRNRSLLSPSSCCGFCKNSLKAWMNIPILSFVLMGGRCGFCGYAYSIRYPIVEASTSLMFLAVWYVYGLSLTMGALSCFAALLIAISFIDLEFKIIPDSMSIGGWVIALLISALNFPDYPVNIIESFIGSVGGVAFFWLISRAFYFITKEEGLGGGDIKLIGLIGATLGIKGVITTVLVGSILGSLVGLIFIMFIMKKTKRFPIPFGPFLAVGSLVNLFQLDNIFWPY